MKNWKVAFITFYDNEGNLLLNNRHDSWELMGGGIEENEEPKEAIKREVREELNYEIDEEKDNLKFVKRFEITHNDRLYEVFFFQAKFPGFQAFSSSEEIDISNLKFFSINNALTLPLLPLAQKILQMMHA